MLNVIAYTNQITTIYSAAAEFLKATQYQDRFATAIDLMNQVDIDLHSQAELFSIFDKAFFQIISKNFVDYLAKNLKLSSNELFSHAWFRALSMIPEFMKELENYNEDVALTNP